MKQLELNLGIEAGYIELKSVILEEIRQGVSIAGLEGMRAGIYRRDDMDGIEKRAYYKLINTRIQGILDYGKRR